MKTLSTIYAACRVSEKRALPGSHIIFSSRSRPMPTDWQTASTSFTTVSSRVRYAALLPIRTCVLSAVIRDGTAHASV